MTIYDILAIVIPPCLAYAFGQRTRLQMVQEQEQRSAERVRDTMTQAREHHADDELKQALRNALVEISQQAEQLKELQAQAQDHQTSINRLAERTF